MHRSTIRQFFPRLRPKCAQKSTVVFGQCCQTQCARRSKGSRLKHVIGEASPGAGRMVEMDRQPTVRGVDARYRGSRTRPAALVLAIVAGSLACGNGDDAIPGNGIGPDAGPGGGGGQAGEGPSLGAGFSATGHGSPGAEPETWTYLVYMVADNPLEPFARERIEELMRVGTGEGVTILAQVDRAAGESSEAFGNLADFTGAMRFRVDPGSLSEAAPLGVVDSGSGATFAEFLSWGIATAPADHYALLLWDHGAAWSHFGNDGSHQNEGLDLNELARALDVSIAAHALRGPFDLLGFDACLLGTWEVAAALSGRVRYLLASEELEPGHGWDFQSLAVAKGGRASPAALGSALIQGYTAKAQARGTFARITLALTDLNRMGPLTSQISALGRALSAAGEDRSLAAAIGRSRATLGVFGHVPRGTSSSMVDLRLWSEALAAERAELLPALQAIEDALDTAVIDQVSGDAHPEVGGLSIYLPNARSAYSRAYDVLPNVGDWRNFVSGYLEAGRSLESAPVFAAMNGRATVAANAGGLVATSALQPGSFAEVASTTIAFGLVTADGTAFLLGEKPATLQPSGIVRGEWDGRAIQLSQDGLTDYAAFVVEPGSSGVSTVSIPLEYTDEDEVETIVLVAALDVAGNVLSQRYYQPIDGAWAERAPAAGSTLAVIVPTRAPESADFVDVAQSATFDGELPLRVESVPVGTGRTVFVRLGATDYAGHVVTIDGTGTL
jgi:hypothetical protein